MKEKLSGIAWIVLLAIVVIGPFVFLLIFASLPESINDIVEQHQEEIVSERGELRLSYSGMEEIQKENGSTYYIDIEDNLMQETDGKEKCLIQGVSSFFVDNQDIFYIKASEKSQGVFRRRMGDEEETQVVSEDVSMFAMGSGENYACTDRRLIRFDTEWREKDSDSLPKRFRSSDGWVSRYQAKGDSLIFCTDNGYLYEYSLTENKMEQWEVPIQPKKTENDVITDLAMRNGELYYLSCQYTPSDVGTDDDLVECKENGIYRMDFETKTLEKVSDSCGFMLLNLEDDLYVVNSGFFFKKLKKCEWIK